MIRTSYPFASFVAFAILFSTCPSAAAPTCRTTIPGGVVAGATWTLAGSPYCVTGDLGVSLLTIKPGVKVLVDGPYEISVLSTIDAEGTGARPILFSAKDSAVSWKGLKFENTPPGSVLKNCIVEYSNSSGIEIINSPVDIIECNVRNNTAQNGAGIYVYLDANPPLEVKIDATTIANNRSTLAGNACNGAGSGNGGGGGVYAIVSAGSLVFDHSKIKNNTSGRSGGVRGSRFGSGMYIQGSALITNSQIIGNTTYSYNCPCAPGAVTSRARGAGLYASGAISIQNSVVKDNLSYARACFTGSGVASGSGIYVGSGVLDIVNSVVSDNNSSGNGPGNTVASRGAVFVNAGTTNIENSTITSNDKVGLTRQGGTVTVVNSILYFNNGGGQQISGTVSVTYSDVQGGIAGTGNIDFNPVLDSSRLDLPIVIGSPASDAGDPSSGYDDLCLPPSLGATRNDMGAHGGPGGCDWDDDDLDLIPDIADNCADTANSNQLDTNDDGYGQLCDADLDDSGKTNTLDLRIYKAAHNSCSGDASFNEDADFNGDGCVNTLDLNILKGLYRKPPGPSCCGL